MNEKILVADDEKEIADLVELYLKNEGFQVLKYYDGAQAMKAA
ncbi:MAG: response regulator transcription factor, partial [Lachnospiraceae bacterium]|nr:response regulator transcription factor [Lachnospiraceae bacterium]